jgi:hypothetical protein
MKGIQGCGIDTESAEPGTEYHLQFVVWDRNVPPMMATVERVIRVLSPCSPPEAYCSGIGTVQCYTPVNAQTDSDAL